jgi:hypothetical protein
MYIKMGKYVVETNNEVQRVAPNKPRVALS